MKVIINNSKFKTFLVATQFALKFRAKLFYQYAPLNNFQIHAFSRTIPKTNSNGHTHLK